MFAAMTQFLLVILVCSAHSVNCGPTYGNQTDHLSLLEFKKAISFDPRQALISWNESIHFCHWEGVLCSTKNPGRVTSVNLENLLLVGEISSSLGNLTFLKNLSLSTNRFTGQIPPSLSQLHRLQALYLSNNTLQGSIPDFANCSSLKVLWLNNNNLAGQFPGLPPQLQSLWLSDNNLTGTIPSSLANITTLNKISCVSNNIGGNIPREFAMLPELQILYMGSNQLTGRFPQAILNLSTLTGLGLNNNHFIGKVPPNLGDSLPNLQILAIAINFFDGLIPLQLANASNLYTIDISYNNFTGVVPSSIGKLTKLSKLNLEMNQLQARNKKSWDFMNALANCTELQGISLAGNRLEGLVPSSLGNLSLQLQRLYLGGNRLSGGFPSGIRNLPNLIILGLNDNQFTGMVPEWIGTLESLQVTSLERNIFTGPIPSSLSNLSQLAVLLLGSNRFGGKIPKTFGNLQMLDSLSISNNLLGGTVPKEVFSIATIRQIDLSFNKLDGQVPIELGNAKQLIVLMLSSNKLSGNIPNTLVSCESLEFINLDWNLFEGSIPTLLGSISSLIAINLSHNNLTGSIPVSLGNLQLLEQLDLSFNHLEGEVPFNGIFKNATAVRIDGNNALCGGAQELHLVTCIMPFSSNKHRQSIVQKLLISIASIVTVCMVIYLFFFWRGKQTRKTVILPSFGNKFPKVSYSDLAKATEGFSASNLIGKGRYSFVYQGKLFQDRILVAIKVFSLDTRGAKHSFIAECNALRNVRHRNLVPILTACSSIDSKGNDFKALVSEFMPGGDLHALLYSTRDGENTSHSSHITMAQRLSIMVNVADALEYLHHNSQGTVVHCDLKPSNILLDDSMTAHVGDFGLARLKVDSEAPSFGDSVSTSSVAIKGTIGYVPPECGAGGEFSTAGDVYSFGIVLLELLLRKRPTDDMFKDGLNIAEFVEMNIPDRMSQIVDAELLDDMDDFSTEASVSLQEKHLECILSVLKIGLCCCKQSPNERMDMREVAARLHRIEKAYTSTETELN